LKQKNSTQSQLNLNTNKKKYSHSFFIIISASFIITALITLLFPNFFFIWNMHINDAFFKLKYKIKGKEKFYPYIIHVDINDTILEEYKDRIDDRSIYSDLIEVLDKSEVNSIIFDIVFSDKKNKLYDDMLAKASRTSGRVYYPVILKTAEYQRIFKPALPGDEKGKNVLEKFLVNPKVRNKGKPIISSYSLRPLTNLQNPQKGSAIFQCFLIWTAS
jgi:CHASE2 domain-containing sensor protein